MPGGAYAVTIQYQKVATQGLVFRVIASKKSGQKDGDGIKRVEFRVRDGQGNEVFKHNESSNPYCAFQEAGRNNCRVIPLGPGAKWYDSKTRIVPGFYTLEVTVRGKDGNRLDSSVGFEIR